MLAIHARYRGRALHRAELVSQSATALATLAGVGEFESCGVEDIRAVVADAEALTNLVMALLADGQWAIGLGLHPTSDTAADPQQRQIVLEAASAALTPHAKAGQVAARHTRRGHDAQAVVDIFSLIAVLLHKRSAQGRQATALMRQGLSQNEAAAELGISKQAMSQRLQAAGWAAELAGWRLAISLIASTESGH